MFESEWLAAGACFTLSRYIATLEMARSSREQAGDEPSTNAAIVDAFLHRDHLDRSAERKSKRLDASIEELDFERSIDDRRRLPDQLVKTLFGNDAITLSIHIDAMSGAWRLTVDGHAKSPRSTAFRPHDEMQITRVETVGDPTSGGIRHGELLLHRPIAGNSS